MCWLSRFLAVRLMFLRFKPSCGTLALACCISSKPLMTGLCVVPLNAACSFNLPCTSLSPGMNSLSSDSSGICACMEPLSETASVVERGPLFTWALMSAFPAISFSCALLPPGAIIRFTTPSLSANGNSSSSASRVTWPFGSSILAVPCRAFNGPLNFRLPCTWPVISACGAS